MKRKKVIGRQDRIPEVRKVMPGYNGMIQGSEHGSIFRQFGDYKGISGDSGSDDEDPDGGFRESVIASSLRRNGRALSEGRCGPGRKKYSSSSGGDPFYLWGNREQ